MTEEETKLRDQFALKAPPCPEWFTDSPAVSAYFEANRPEPYKPYQHEKTPDCGKISYGMMVCGGCAIDWADRKSHADAELRALKAARDYAWPYTWADMQMKAREALAPKENE